MKISVARALMLLCFAACTAKVSTPVPGTIRVQLGAEPTHLNPYVAETGAEMTILRNLVRAPLRFVFDGDWKIAGDAARSYAWSADGRKLTLAFPEDLRWSDGAALTACQFRDGILRMLGQKTGMPSPLSELYSSVVGYSKAISGRYEELDASIRCRDLELTMRTSKPFDRNLLNALAFLGSAPWREGLNEHRVSSGAFRLVEWKKGRSIKITAVSPARFLAPDFEFFFIADPDTALIMYEKGDLEILTELPGTLLPKLRDRADFHRTPMMATYYVAFDTRSPGWACDARVRKALALAAGRDEIPGLLQGGERPAFTLTPDDLLPEKLLKEFRVRHGEDVAEAKRLWREVSAEGPRAAPSRISLGYPSGSRHQLLMERLANNWRTRLGVQVTFEPQEWNHYLAVLKKDPPSVFRHAWTAVYPDPRFFLGLFARESPNNFGRWSSSSYEAKLAALDPAKLGEEGFWPRIFEAEDLLVWQEAALIPLYHYAKTYMARGKIAEKLRFTYNGFVDVASLTKDE